jgi:hypothetical protein
MDDALWLSPAEEFAATAVAAVARHQAELAGDPNATEDFFARLALMMMVCLPTRKWSQPTSGRTASRGLLVGKCCSDASG